MQPLFFVGAPPQRTAKVKAAVEPVDIGRDLHDLARVRYSGFFDKHGLLLLNRCFFERWRVELWTRWVYSCYATACSDKLTRCAVVRDEDGVVVGVMQLAYPNELGDLTLAWPLYSGSECSCKDIYVEWIAVAPEARGQGVGKKLLDWAAVYARAANRSLLTLTVMWTNPAIRLYLREGFTIDHLATWNPINLAQGLSSFPLCGQRYCVMIHMSKKLSDDDVDEPRESAPATSTAPQNEGMNRR